MMGCNECEYDDVFQLTQQPIESSDLKINGFYYSIGNEGNIASSFVFYQNGVFLYGGGSDPNSFYDPIVQLEMQFSDTEFLDYIYDHKPAWGYFVVNDSVIMIEKFYCSDGHCKAFLRQGAVLNDSTFHITEYLRSGTENIVSIDELYQFHAFQPKPDSLNSVLM